VKPELTLTAAALAALALFAGCADRERPATWAYISPVIMQPNCASGSCHSPAAAVAGLDFSTPDRGYSSLTRLWVWVVDPAKAGQPGCGPAAGTTVCEQLFRPLVTPYDPDESRLVNVLRGRDAPRMPPDRPLDEADIRLIEDWILNGARQDSSGGDASAPEGGTTQPIDGAADGSADGGAAFDAPVSDARDAADLEAPKD
jgi:hypothetical protein